MELIKWKGNPEVDEHHRQDYRGISNKEERESWIRKNWEVEHE